MIQANDLRIGNKLTDEFYEHFKTIITVTSINDKGINLIIEDDGNFPECASNWIEPEYMTDILFGIPLTAEILEKCGFKLFPWGYVKISSKEFGVRLNLRTFSYDVSGNGGVQLKYLHQLQNLFYSLTGEELTVTL